MKGNVSGYVCNHGSPSGERDTASPGLWAMLRTQASDEEADDVSSRRHLYCGTPVVTSWAVAWPTGGVFSYVSSDRVTLRAFPVATPRGRSVSFPTRGTMVTYVTWDVIYLLLLLKMSRIMCFLVVWHVDTFCVCAQICFVGATLRKLKANTKIIDIILHNLHYWLTLLTKQ